MKVRYIKNENGYALVMVILLVVIFTTLGMGLLAMNINANKQFNVKEDQVQARHQAEMGVLHYKEEIVKILNLNAELDKTAIKKELIKIGILTEGQYTVRQTKEPVTFENNKIEIYITSKGTSEVLNNKSISKDIDATIIISGTEKTSGSGNHSPPPQSKSTEKVIGNLVIPENGYFSNAENIHVTGNLDAVNGNKNTNMLVKNDLYIEGGFVMNNHTCVVVGGDLTVLGTNTKNMSGKVYIVVYGNAYFKNPPEKINNAQIYVAGKVTGVPDQDLSDYKGSIPIGAGCPEPPKKANEIIWSVEPTVNPIYK